MLPPRPRWGRRGSGASRIALHPPGVYFFSVALFTRNERPGAVERHTQEQGNRRSSCGTFVPPRKKEDWPKEVLDPGTRRVSQRTISPTLIYLWRHSKFPKEVSWFTGKTLWSVLTTVAKGRGNLTKSDRRGRRGKDWDQTMTRFQRRKRYVESQRTKWLSWWSLGLM